MSVSAPTELFQRRLPVETRMCAYACKPVVMMLWRHLRQLVIDPSWSHSCKMWEVESRNVGALLHANICMHERWDDGPVTQWPGSAQCPVVSLLSHSGARLEPAWVHCTRHASCHLSVALMYPTRVYRNKRDNRISTQKKLVRCPPICLMTDRMDKYSDIASDSVQD